MNSQRPCNSVLFQQLGTGFLIASLLGLGLLATAVVPLVKGLATITQTEVRPGNPRSAVASVPVIADGHLSVVNYVHRAVSPRGITSDQAFRLLAMLAFLSVFCVRVLFPSRVVRCGLVASSLMGAAGCLCDFLSYWTIGGVVDWIGVSGRSAFAPSDLCWALAPIGMFLSAVLGLTTFCPGRLDCESIARSSLVPKLGRSDGGESFLVYHDAALSCNTERSKSVYIETMPYESPALLSVSTEHLRVLVDICESGKRDCDWTDSEWAAAQALSCAFAQVQQAG